MADKHFDFEKDPNLITTHLGEEYERYYNAITPPIFMNSLNVFPDIDAYYAADKFDEHTFIYGRVSNPTVRILEKKVAALEKGYACVFFASGMAAATTAAMSVLKPSSHIVCIYNAYGPLRVFLTDYCNKQMGMKLTFVKGDSVAEFENAVTDETDLIVLESPSSVMMGLQDLGAVAKIAKKHGAVTYIDNTCATPLHQNPLDFGIDIVMHTASKYLGGHSDVVAGCLVVGDEARFKDLMGVQRELFGGILGPMEAWLVLRGLRTLDVRLERHQQTGTRVAEYLDKHPRVKKVYYPKLESFEQHDLYLKQQRGCCGLMSFELDGTTEQAKQLVNSLELFKIGVSWGGFESLACMPMLHQVPELRENQGAQPGLIRIHCGLEGADNLLEDLDRNLRAL